MSSENIPLPKPESWGSTIAALALFTVAGIVLIVMEIPHDWGYDELLLKLSFVFIGWLLVAATGYSIGWIKKFPRWSYPYTTQMVLFSLYLMRASTPGLQIFGYPFGSSDAWGWRAWLPAILATLVALFVTRSLQPIGAFLQNIWEDWTLSVFALYSLLPLIIFVIYDEMDRLYTLYCMVALSLMMIGTVLLYMRSHTFQQRAITLAIGTLLAVSFAFISIEFYWSGQGYGDFNIIRTGITILVICTFIFSPAIIGLFQRFSLRSSTTKAF
jgi:hypothetical protein